MSPSTIKLWKKMTPFIFSQTNMRDLLKKSMKIIGLNMESSAVIRVELWRYRPTLLTISKLSFRSGNIPRYLTNLRLKLQVKTKLDSLCTFLCYHLVLRSCSLKTYLTTKFNLINCWILNLINLEETHSQMKWCMRLSPSTQSHRLLYLYPAIWDLTQIISIQRGIGVNGSFSPGSHHQS